MPSWPGRCIWAQARADSNDPVAHFNLASALFKARRYRDAEQPLLEALRIDPQYAPALLLLSRNNEAQTFGGIAVVARQRTLCASRLDEELSMQIAEIDDGTPSTRGPLVPRSSRRE